jgi:hypothetical protein
VNVAIICHRDTGDIVNVVECPPVLNPPAFLATWTGRHGLPCEAARHYRIAVLPIIPYAEVAMLDVPFCEIGHGEGI